jgi:hypothetical protein
MLMRHHWGLGIGHIYSHEHHSHPSHSKLTDLIEPDDTSEDQANGLNLDLRMEMEWEDDNERGGPMEVEDPELGLEECDKDPELEWDSFEDELSDISSEELELL